MTHTTSSYIKLLLQLSFLGGALRFKLVNDEVGFLRKIGNIVEFQLLYFNEESEILFGLISDPSSQLCFLHNGRKCKCFDDFMRVPLILGESCISKESFYFSLGLYSFKNDTASIISAPVYVPHELDAYLNDGNATFFTESNDDWNTITLLLPLTLDDLSRSSVLFQSLKQIPTSIVYEMLIYVPDYQHDLISRAISGLSVGLNFPCRVCLESSLFYRSTPGAAYPYAIQMAIKLLAARVIKTAYYLTLDADVILLRPFALSRLLTPSPSSSLFNTSDDGSSESTTDSPQQETASNASSTPAIYTHTTRALYENENRFLFHPNWWEGSEKLLGIASRNPKEQGFGVTPALLSTFGSLLTLETIATALSSSSPTDATNPAFPASPSGRTNTNNDGAHGNERNGNSHTAYSGDGNCEGLECVSYDGAAVEAAWLESLGKDGILWSEYTLYRVVLDYYQVFNELHVAQTDSIFTIPSSSQLEPASGVADFNAEVEVEVDEFKVEFEVGVEGVIGDEREQGKKTTNTSKRRLDNGDGGDGDSSPRMRLHCYNVWYAEQLPWQAEKAFGKDCNCLFSVVQSSTGVSPGSILKQYLQYRPPSSSPLPPPLSS